MYHKHLNIYHHQLAFSPDDDLSRIVRFGTFKVEILNPDRRRNVRYHTYRVPRTSKVFCDKCVRIGIIKVLNSTLEGPSSIDESISMRKILTTISYRLNLQP